MPKNSINIAGTGRQTSLRGLRTFCVAARHASFSAAAQELHITASAVSHQIKSLEQELGRTLFDRSGRALTLTVDGRAMFAEIDPLIRRLDEVTARYRGGQPRTVLRVSVQPFFASEMFVPRLPEFTARHPDVDLRVDTSDETSERHPADVDVSIRLFSSPPQDHPSELLFPLRLLPAGSPAFRDRLKLAGNRIVGEFPLIVHESRPRAWQQWAESADVQLPVGSTVIRLDSMIAVARAAERGAGAALVPLPLSHAWFDSASLVPLFDHELVIPDGYYLVTRKDVAADGLVRLFREWVLQVFDREC